jgi:hypothetical protein
MTEVESFRNPDARLGPEGKATAFGDQKQAWAYTQPSGGVSLGVTKRDDSAHPRALQLLTYWQIQNGLLPCSSPFPLLIVYRQGSAAVLISMSTIHIGKRAESITFRLF